MLHISDDTAKKPMWYNNWSVLKKFGSFLGPGIMVSVAYMDPGNYSTAVSAGAMYEYKLLFIIFISNVAAVILQCLCVKLGTITGLDLAEFCRLNLPYHINLSLYVCAEIAIIATDLAEVIGTAISLEILFGIPLFYGVLITILDVLIVLMAYHKDGTMRETRKFEIMVSILVIATCICFILELFNCSFESGAFSAIIKGYLPVNGVIFREQNALFLSCGIVGSTVMPHSLYLGSSLVQSRLKDYDIKHNNIQIQDDENEDEVLLPATTSKFRSLSDGRSLAKKYKPSYQAIQNCLSYSYWELILSLSIIAIFVNSSILIVASSTLYGQPDAADADLLSIYKMLSYYISPAAGLIFALSMLFSGQSAGIVCTMAGQIISEGFINWSMKPWIRRILTRVLAIMPVLIMITITGREGVTMIMNSSQVVLSFILPIVSAPLIWFTSRKEYMTVYNRSIVGEDSSLLENDNRETEVKKVTFENGTTLRALAILTWLVITFLNMYLIFAFANGADI